jgi:rhodanese-related sulfurtransferase
MRRIVLEIITIILVSSLIAILYNNASDDSLPLFKEYDKNIDKNIEQTNTYFQEVEAEFVKQLVENREAIIIDARQSSFYEKGHIPGSMSLPLNEFEDLFPGLESLLRGDQIIITYCIGISCRDSLDLALKLQEKGIQGVMIYKGGMEEWLEKGYEIEK